MPPSGGLADKIGNRYEGRIAVWRILQLLDEQHDSVRAEVAVLDAADARAWADARAAASPPS